MSKAHDHPRCEACNDTETRLVEMLAERITRERWQEAFNRVEGMLVNSGLTSDQLAPNNKPCIACTTSRAMRFILLGPDPDSIEERTIGEDPERILAAVFDRPWIETHDGDSSE